MSAVGASARPLPLNDRVAAIGEDNLWDQIERVCLSSDEYYGLVHAVS
jgi:hypothetical protein